MFLILAVLTLLGPVVAGVLTAALGAVLLRKRVVLGASLIGLPTLMGVFLLWELRYDLDIPLPEVSWMPSGASSELAMVIVAALACLGLIVAFFNWPQETRFRSLAGVTIVLWIAIIAAGWALSQVNFSY